MKLMADVIDLAINEYLWAGQANIIDTSVQSFSCNAILAATKCDESATEGILNFLCSMGMYPSATQELDSIPSGTKRQYARALWLTWAAMIAREEEKTL